MNSFGLGCHFAARGNPFTGLLERLADALENGDRFEIEIAASPRVRKVRLGPPTKIRQRDLMNASIPSGQNLPRRRRRSVFARGNSIAMASGSCRRTTFYKAVAAIIY